MGNMMRWLLVEPRTRGTGEDAFLPGRRERSAVRRRQLVLSVHDSLLTHPTAFPDHSSCSSCSCSSPPRRYPKYSSPTAPL